MRYIVDHDIHMHSQISSCSSDPLQTKEALLAYAKRSGYKYICVTDHYWDERVPGPSDWYAPQNTEHIRGILPLPEDPEVKFYYGCETELRADGTLGISREGIDELDFVIIPTTHLHMRGFTIAEEDWDSLDRRAELWVSRFRRVLDMDLPFHKIGIAHITATLLAGSMDSYTAEIGIMNRIPDSTLYELFTKAAGVGVGIELNTPIEVFEGQELEDELRTYRIAKECGCKFYMGSDSHHPAEFDVVPKRFEMLVDLLGLTEEDKFDPFKK